MLNQINEAAAYIEKQGVTDPEIGVILGTGLGRRFVGELKNPIVINYNSIPHFPVSTVESHKGRLIYGTIKKRKVLAMEGRFHYYEGYSMKEITLPVRVMKLLGVKNLLISNAAGNMNLKWKKGELMVIDDHINLQPDNGPVPMLTGQAPERYRQFSQELRISSPVGQPIEYMAGAYVQSDRLITDEEFGYFFLTPKLKTLAPFAPYLPLGQRPGGSWDRRAASALAAGS